MNTIIGLLPSQRDPISEVERLVETGIPVESILAMTQEKAIQGFLGCNPICTVRYCANWGALIGGAIYSVFEILAFIGMVLYEFPEGIGTFLLLEWGGFTKQKSTWYTILAVAIITPIGALVSYPFISNIKQSTFDVLLALSAGALVFVAAFTTPCC